MPELIPFLKKDDIEKMVSDVAHRISSDYQDCELVLIGVLKGAFLFVADLVRHLTIPVKVDFIRVSSYGSDTSSSGNVCLTQKAEIDIKDKDVLIVEDIIDTGLTLDYIIKHLESLRPKSLRICTLLDKRERRMTKVPIDYAGCAVGEGFLVGYGLDHAENYRNFPEIYHLKL
jgi:hypoxanthine phosphoribosyltransferase